MIVMIAFRKLEINKHYLDEMSDFKGDYHLVGFFVIKEATRQEYIDNVTELYGKKVVSEYVDAPADSLFYWVSID